MHLWPTMKVQNSFKQDFSTRLDRIASQKRQQRQASAARKRDPNKYLWPSAFCRQLLFFFTCGGFCFGVFSDEDDTGCM